MPRRGKSAESGLDRDRYGAYGAGWLYSPWLPTHAAYIILPMVGPLPRG
jgi:hypothetical protein